MLDTKLILIEGIPGAGKTTTSEKLGKWLNQQGTACRWYLEIDKPHPIDCHSLKLKDLKQKLPPLWRTYVENAAQESFIDIIKGRLWHNTTLFMFMNQYPQIF